MTTAGVARLFIATAHQRPMTELQEVRAIGNRGFEGCVHGRPGSKRQVLLVEEETLIDFGLEPGVVRENVTTTGIRLAEIFPGERLRVGEAVFEITGNCEPCDRMDELRMGLQEELLGRRGTLCRVIEGGLIRRGDEIELLGVAVMALGSGGKS